MHELRQNLSGFSLHSRHQKKTKSPITSDSDSCPTAGKAMRKGITSNERDLLVIIYLVN